MEGKPENYEFIWKSPYIVGVWEHVDGRVAPRMLNHLSGRPDDIFPMTPERLAKGDLDLVLSRGKQPLYAEAVDDTVLAALVRARSLDQHHAFYAKVFRDLRSAFRRKLDYKANAVFAAEFFGADTSDGVFEMIYLRVCRRLRLPRERLVLYAIETPLGAPFARRALRRGGAYREAFDALADAVDEGRDWAREQIRLRERRPAGIAETVGCPSRLWTKS